MFYLGKTHPALDTIITMFMQPTVNPHFLHNSMFTNFRKAEPHDYMYTGGIQTFACGFNAALIG